LRAVDARGGLDDSVVRKQVLRGLPAMQECYANGTGRDFVDPVVIEFVIQVNGSVGGASARGGDPDAIACATEVIEAMRFPRPSGEIVRAEVSVDFRWR
jgi:hypothetical protein